MAKILSAGGVSFANLAKDETCTGDPARRAGNEYLFQMLAQQNVDTLNGYNASEDCDPLPTLPEYHAERVPIVWGGTTSGSPY